MSIEPPRTDWMPRDFNTAFGTLNSPSIATILQERLRQIEKYKHDEHADAEREPIYLPNKAAAYLYDARDFIHGHLGVRDIAAAERKLVIAGALIIAALDRLALEPRDPPTE